MKRLFLSLYLVIGYAGAIGAELTESQSISPALFPTLRYQRQGEPFNLPLKWRYSNGDKAEYAKPLFDDSKWRSIEVGRPIPGSGWRWYRLKFTPPETLNGKDLLLSLGAISVSDQVYINGTKVGEFGGRPPHFIQRSSDVLRLYPIPSKYWLPGENTIAVRVFSGAKGGMYRGPYSLQGYDDRIIYSKMNQKVRGPDALETLLFDSPIPLRFSPGSPIIIEPQFTRLNAKAVMGRLSADLVNSSGEVIKSDGIDLAIRGMLWSGAQFRFQASDREGAYTCHLKYTVDGQTLWSKALPFEVGLQKKISYELPHDPAIKDLPHSAYPVSISEASVGRYGPREVGEDFKLYDDLTKTDARSGVAYSVQIEKALGAPHLFLANTRPVPTSDQGATRFHRVAGHQYDGLSDSWSYGSIRPSGGSALKDLIIKDISWVKRSYSYLYQGGERMDFSISAISPAWVVDSSAKQISVFHDIEKHGIGLPSHLAYQTAHGVKVVSAEAGLSGEEMTANWVMAWFGGSQGWDKFDTPYLFVLQRQPKRVQSVKGQALIFDYTKPSGLMQGMPLYGVTLQPLVRIRPWSSALPEEVIERCHYWSQVLINAPEQVQRSTGADFQSDRLLVNDVVTHLEIKDDWGTKGIRIAPVSPTLALSAKAGKIDIAAATATRDLQMATLQGPFVAVENRSELTFRIKGLLGWLEQPREAKPLATSYEAEAVRTDLNRIVTEGLTSELNKHPWSGGVQHQTFIPGRHRARYSNLLLALPYLDQPLRAAVEKEIQKETETYFLSTEKPPAEMASLLAEKDRDLPLLVDVYNPYNRLTIAMAPYGLTRFGIDQPYFDSLNIYMCWHYAQTTQRFEWLSGHYETLQRLFNAVRNSHDWATGVSWDSLSGLRVGNGQQESSGIYAAMVAMMRMAHKFDDDATAQRAAYYAHMQLVGMQAQLYASDYLRQNRPWLYANTRHEQIEYAQQIRGNYFAEFNEFAGLSQAIISSGNIARRPDNLSGSSPNGLVESPLPEVMRLYQKLWPDFINDFYDPKYDALIQTDRTMDPNVSVDTFVYQLSSYPCSIDEIFAARKNANYSWWTQMTDARAYLDYLGQKSKP